MVDLSTLRSQGMDTLASVADTEALHEELHEGIAVVPHRLHLAISKHGNSYRSIIRLAARKRWIVEGTP